MNARERFLAIMNFESCDRCLLWEFGYWPETMKKWYAEGLPRKDPVEGDVMLMAGEAQVSPVASIPRDKDVHDYFKLDKGLERVAIDDWIFPLFEEQVLEEDEHTKVVLDEWNIKKKIRKDGESVPQFISWPVKNRSEFERMKERFDPDSRGRFPANWQEMVQYYNDPDFPLGVGGFPVGLFGSLRYLMGENLYYAYYDDPALIKEMINFLVEFWISLWEKVLLDVGVDFALFWEDLAYKNGPLMSPEIFQEFMMPGYERMTQFLKEKGVKIILVDTDGNWTELIPLFLESGITGSYPFEVQAGMDVVEVRRRYPNLHIIGGLDKIKIAQGRKQIDKELTKVPGMLKHGAFVPCIDHNVPPDISWKNFKYYRDELAEIIDHASKT